MNKYDTELDDNVFYNMQCMKNAIGKLDKAFSLIKESHEKIEKLKRQMEESKNNE